MHKLVLVVLAVVAHVARSADDAAQAAPQSVSSNTCTGPQGTYQPGERYCVDETTSRVCNWHGVWVEQKCDVGKCQQYKDDPKKVQCFQYNKVDYPTGPPPGFDTAGLVPVGNAGSPRRLRRNEQAAKDAAGQAPVGAVAPTQNDQAPQAAPAKSDTCTGGPPGIDQPGDRYCVDESTNRVCNWGGEWVEFKCEEGSKCQTLKSDPKKVQCFKDNRHGYPTGPPAGAEADSAPAAAPVAAAPVAAAPAAPSQSRRLRRNMDKSAPKPQSDAAASPVAPAAPTQNDQAPAPQASPAKSDTCTGGPPGVDQPGDRYCVDESTNRVCNWGGEWVEFKCEEGSKCQTLKTDPKKVQCFKDNRHGYPTGPPAGAQADAAGASQ